MQSVTEILKVIAQDFGPDPDRVEMASIRGTKAHSACFAYATSLYPVLSPETEGYFRSFRGWWDEMVAEVMMEPEVELSDPRMGFMGHPDMGWLKLKNGKNALIDLKTPVAYRKTWSLQCGAYWHLVRLATNLTIIEPGCLMLDPDGGTARMVWVENPERCFALFCGALNLKRFLEGGK